MRNKIILILVLSALYCKARAATDTMVINLKNVSIITNSVNGFDLRIDFKFDLDSQIIDEEYVHFGKNGKPKFYITYQDAKSNDSCLKVHAYGESSGIGAIVSGFTQNEMKYFLAKDNQIGIQCKEDFIVCYYKSTILKPTTGDYKYGIVKADDVNNLIVKSLSITDSDRSSYITAINNFYYFENKIDFGVDPGSSGSPTSFILSASIRNRFAPSKSLKCNCKKDSTQYSPQIFWSLTTRLSTNFSDSLNFIDFSPITLAWSSKDFSKELNLKLENESDQNFTNKRAAVDATFKTIIPNLVYLTTPQDNRLRLKPIVNLGAKGYYDYSNGITAFYSGEGYFKAYYYIPVYNNYSLIINGMAFYDLSTMRNPDRKISTNYSVTVASELGTSGFKAIVKFENGKSDINYKSGQAVVLGLLMDFLKDKKK